MGTVVAYDFVQVNGGAEHVSRLLARELSAELLVHSVSDELKNEPHERVRLRSLTTRGTSHRRIPRAMSAWAAFETMRKHADVSAVVFAGHYAPLSWRAFPDARRILYLHALPLPCLYQTGGGTALDLFGTGAVLARPALKLLGRRYARAIANMHRVFANSVFVAERLRESTGITAEVLHPPVDDRFFSIRDGNDAGSYWLSWARHEPMKRIDRLIDAFLRMPDQRLEIAGSGSCTAVLMARAKGASNISFSGSLDTDALLDKIRGATGALHVSRQEPYGIAVAEAVAAGKFVIVSDEGGAREIVEPGASGMLIAPDPTPDQIVAAVRECRGLLRERTPGPRASRIMRVPEFMTAIRSALAEGRLEPGKGYG